MIAISLRLAHLRALGAIICATLLGISTAVAQVEQAEIRSSANYIYGQSMDFNLFAANLGKIEGVTLFFRLGASSDTYSANIPVTPGSRVDVTYPLDLSQIRLPPFTSITYWWQIEREIGSPLLVPEQVISYVDDQFVWRQLVVTDEQGGGSIRVHWTGENDILGEQARTTLFEMLPEISHLIPLQQILPFDVYIYPSTGDLGAALRLAGRDFQPGQSYPDLGVALVTVVNPETAKQELRDELSRELVDLFLYQALGQASYDLPPWLNRGLAGVIRGERDTALENTFLAAASAGATIPLVDLCAMDDIDSDLAAAQSESLVGYLVEVYGESAVRALVTEFSLGADCRTAFSQATRQTPEQIETAWLRARSSSRNSRTVAEMAVWLVLVLAGFGFAGLLLLWPRRRQH